MATSKISITLDADVLEEARHRSQGNLSAYVNEAVRRRVKNELLDEALHEWEGEFGAITEGELAEARRLLAD